jgi:hypothetical protein
MKWKKPSAYDPRFGFRITVSPKRRKIAASSGSDTLAHSASSRARLSGAATAWACRTAGAGLPPRRAGIGPCRNARRSTMAWPKY